MKTFEDLLDEAHEEAYRETRFKIAINLIKKGSLDDEEISSFTGVSVEEVAALREKYDTNKS